MAITNIGQKDIQRITSGQVITDLISVVKELVENSIDAGSSKIDITFNNYGLDSIEVTDDGAGIRKEDFPLVCLKHCTSKLTSFQQLSEEGLLTLGFRGEAMSSLCSIAGSVLISTCTKEDFPRATQLNYDNMGKLTQEKKVVGGLRGTNVKVLQIFKNLPVRQKNLAKNLKREFNKAINHLMSYLIMFNNIRFTIFNINVSGKKTLLMGTKGGMKTSVLDNLVSIYGTNGSYGLIPIDFAVTDYHARPIVGVGKGKMLVDAMDLKFSGYVSNCSFGLGRSSSDRQFIYLNKRPIVTKKFLKSVNEIYKSFNHVQYPVIILNIDINTKFVDVNVTPDKRVVMIQNEDLINEILREELQKFYEQQSNVIPKNKNSEIRLDGESITILKDRRVQPVIKLERQPDREQENEGVQETPKSEIEQKDPNGEYKQDSELTSEEEADQDHEMGSEEEDDQDLEIAPKEDDEQVHEISPKADDQAHEIGSNEEDSGQGSEVDDDLGQGSEHGELAEAHEEHEEDVGRCCRHDMENNASQHRKDSAKQHTFSKQAIVEITKYDGHSKNKHKNPTICKKVLPVILAGDAQDEILDPGVQPTEASAHDSDSSDELPPDPLLSKSSNDKLTISIGDQVEERQVKRPKIMGHRSDIIFGEDELVIKKQEVSDIYKCKRKLEIDATHWKSLPTASKQGNARAVKDVKVDDIENSEAEAKLSYIINKQDFANMKIIGQFNLGFILVTMNDSKNLFIIDQHASDEKYNYEKYLESINFEKNNQKLIVPRPLELNVIDEMICYENRDIFKHNGFMVEFDDNSDSGRVKLVALPQLKHTQFDVSDFHELIHLINERGGQKAGGTYIKCSKWERLLASRACRTSIMIGQSLTKARMETVVKNLSTLDKPWNCPHGRPTMRHLIELQQMPRFAMDYQI